METRVDFGDGSYRGGGALFHVYSSYSRLLEQTFHYDWLGNSRNTGDDVGGFYDRSLGDIENDGANQKPYQLKSASLDGANGGGLQAKYDAAGSMVGMKLSRSGNCIGGMSGADCTQRFVYDWDEVGRLVRARRWDAEASGVADPLPGATPEADLRNYYDASDQRVLKEAVDDGGNTSYTAYIFASLELRRTQYGAGYASDGDPSAEDFEISLDTVVPYLMANGVRLARVVYHGDSGVPEEGPSTGGGAGDVNASVSKLHVFFELGDHLGSTSVVLDKATGELVERATFQAYGGAESDCRPDRWKSFREDYRFTGKEEDVEVGLQYFGKRFLNPLLGRWISADPLAVHAPGSADLNLYAYVSGAVLKSVDPLGLDAVVKVTGNKIVVQAEIFIHGDGASEEVARQYQQSINDAWNKGKGWAIRGEKQEYRVEFRVTVKVASGEQAKEIASRMKAGRLPATNLIRASDSQDRSYVSSGKYGAWRSRARDGGSLRGDNPAAHEFGHMLGLGDRYSDGTGAVDGWEKNIMGDSAKGRVENRNITEALTDTVKLHESSNKHTAMYALDAMSENNPHMQIFQWSRDNGFEFLTKEDINDIVGGEFVPQSSVTKYDPSGAGDIGTANTDE